LKRLIHTVKNNAALFGIESVAASCHTLEERLGDDSSEEELPSPAEIQQLAALWKPTLAIRDQLTEAQSGSRIELDEDDYRRFVSELRSGAPHEALMATAVSWRLEPASQRLAVIGEQIRALDLE